MIAHPAAVRSPLGSHLAAMGNFDFDMFLKIELIFVLGCLITRPLKKVMHVYRFPPVLHPLLVSFSPI